MALALHETGILCLHGSAVAIEGRGIGFLGPKGYGKSTLAIAIAAAGGRLMSDDLLAITPNSSPEIIPGVHSVRMRDDVTALMAEHFPGTHLQDGWKKTLTNFPRHRLGWDRVVLDALYLINPTPEGSADYVVRRSRMEPMEATLSLATHAKITDLLGNVEAGTMLPWIVEIVSRVTVYELDVPRNLARLPGVAAQICSWHSQSSLPRAQKQ
jgi:hypothetical protein